MGARVRFLTLLVAALCAVGWVPSGFWRAGDDVSAGDGLTALPVGRDNASGIEVRDADDDPGWAPPRDELVDDARVQWIALASVPADEPPVVRRRAPAQPRAPPSIA